MFFAVILSDIFIALLPPLLCALDQIRPCVTFPGGSHATQRTFWKWWISENSQNQIFSILISTCWSWLPDWLQWRPALKQYMSLGVRWDVGTQTFVCPVWLQSATFLCTSCFSQSQGLGLALVPVVSRWKTVLQGYTFTVWPQDRWLKWMAD